MDYIHHARITVFAKEDEDIDKIRQGLIDLAGIDLEKEKIKISEQTATGLTESKIKTFEIFLEKKRHARAFLNNLLELLSQNQKALILKQAQTRLDDEIHFFIRLDKDAWFNSKAELTDSGNCYHIKMSIASYPKNRENALKVINEIFTP